MRKIISIALVLVMGIALLVGCAKEQTQVETKTPLVTINENVSFIDEAEFYLATMKSSFVQQQGEEKLTEPSAANPEITNAEYLKEETLNAVTLFNLSKVVATEKGLTISEEKMAELKETTKQLFENYPEELKGEVDLSMDLLEKMVIDNAYYELLKEDLKKDEAFLSQVEEMKKTDPRYMDIVENGVDVPYIRAKHILIMTIDANTNQPLAEEEKEKARKRAEEVLEMAKKGDDFSELAKQYSEDPGVTQNAGEYTFTKFDMQPEFEEAAYALEVGEISDLVETMYGYHIIKLEEVDIPATEENKKAREDYKAQVEMQMESFAINGYFNTKYEEWKGQYDIKVNEEAWATVEVK